MSQAWSDSGPVAARAARGEERCRPNDAPDIVIVMHDDAEFGQPSTFGGDIATPMLSRLAEEGIPYNAFHTTTMCKPARAALPAGRNHHRLGNTNGLEYTSIATAGAWRIGARIPRRAP